MLLKTEPRTFQKKWTAFQFTRNKERIDIAKKARKNWKACNKNSEIAFSGRIDDRLMVLMSFSIKIEENSTIKSVLDSIEGKLQIMADFLEENVLKGLKQ